MNTDSQNCPEPSPRNASAPASADAAQRIADLEAQLASKTASAIEAARQLEAFAYTVSHDLRAPLRAIKGFTIALREDYDQAYTDQGKDYSKRVIDGVERMETMIAALLTWSRVGRGDIPLVNVDLDNCLVGLQKQWAAEIKTRNGRLEIARPLPAVIANPSLLEVALNHYVSNAVKFVPEGSAPHVRIEAEVVQAEGTETSGNSGNNNHSLVRVKVSDEGIGIEEKNMPKLFQIFQRLNPVESYAGLGTGLAIVRKAADRMSARVGVESEAQKGSTFWIELPKGQ